LILTCERCETRFRLDESRLPTTGARVRCSRCKHAFFVRPPGASPADAIQELAQQAAATGRPTAPEPSWDLEEAAAGRTMQRSARPAAAPSEGSSDFESESDWRFEDEVPQLGDSGASLDLPNGEAPPAPVALDANESSFAELGDPESWDLRGSSSDDITATRVVVPAAVETPRVVVAEATADVAVTPPRAATVADADDAEAVHAAIPVAGVEVSPAVQIGGWIAAAALVAAVALLGLVPSAATSPDRLDTVSVGPLAIQALAPRLVEHALAGPIWVVSGELHNPGTEARSLGAAVGVTLLDAAGAPLEHAAATIALPLAPTSLREMDLERVREEADAAAAALARRSIAPGDSVAVEAVFASAPRGAVRFALTPQPVQAKPAVVEPLAPIEEPMLQPVPDAPPQPSAPPAQS
jgi:predicted Zn finger-like uncharacterized protein